MATKKVKALDHVEVEWINSPYHKNGATSMVHRVQADKLVEAGRAKLVKGGKSETGNAPGKDGTVNV
jgi:hypothetical protein